MDRHVAPSTQNQAKNALVFLYKKILKVTLDNAINSVRAEKKINVPVVMTREEVAKVKAVHKGDIAEGVAYPLREISIFTY